MSLFQPHVLLAYAMPASETQQDPSSAALLAASKPLLQWLNSILTETGKSSNDPSIRTANGHAAGRDSSWRRDKSSHAQVREEFRSSSSSHRASGSSLLGLYALAVAHEQELGHPSSGSTPHVNGSRAPLSEAEGLAAMRALVNALHQQDPAQQQQQQQQGDSTAEEASLLGSLYAYAALETASAAVAAAQRAPGTPHEQQEQEQLTHSRSYHRALSGLSDLAERERSATQPRSRPHSSSRHEPSSQDHAAVYGLLSSLQRSSSSSSSSSSPRGASRQRQGAAGQHHQHPQDGLAVLQLLAALQGSPCRAQQR
jgi:hypothetical protein